MSRLIYFTPPLAAALLCLGVGAARADTSFAPVAEKVNEKVVKLFGAGGIRGLPSYGTGFLVSPDGYILTVSNHILETQELRVHLYNGVRYRAKVVAIEPELDVALIKIDAEKERLDLPYFDVVESAKKGTAEVGTGVLALSNCFLIGTRAEPMSVQRGRVASVSKLQATRGITQAPYTGEVYVIDAITNNPGAAGGPVTTRKGELLGLIGKELRNDLTNTWINYAMPINAKVTVTLDDGKKATRTILELVEKKEKYVSLPPPPEKPKGGGYTGIQLVANPVELTPPYVEEVEAGSPAAAAGLKPDDLIVYVNGLPVNNILGYEELMNGYQPGDEIKLEVQRNRKLNTIAIKLGEFKIKPKKVKKPDDDK